MPVEGRSPDLGQERKVARPRRLAQGLPTPRERVRKLQTSLQAKAKAEPAFRFYSLWDKICRSDVLTEAYRRCRHNAGAPGADGQTFEAIEEHGVEEWLEELREELRNGRYRPKPLLRVWIPKSNGGQRPLGIPAISDRVAQMAALLVIGPIFETDLLANQYGFRPGVDAKMAIIGNESLAPIEVPADGSEAVRVTLTAVNPREAELVFTARDESGTTILSAKDRFVER